MSLLHLDFPSGQTGLYGTNTAYMLNGRYAEVVGAAIVDDPDTNITGNVLQLNDGDYIRHTLPAFTDVSGCALRYHTSGFPPLATSVHQIIQFMSSDGSTPHVTIAASADGYIQAYRGNSGTGTLLGQSGTPSLVTGAWQHIEAKVLISDTIGTVEVRVEGVVVLSLAGQDTRSGGATSDVYSIKHDYVSHVGQEYDMYLKDFAYWDDAGTLNNDFMGSIGVYELIPNGDTSLTWSLSSGSTGFSLIDEAPPVDSDYIYASDPAPAADKMSLTNLPPDVTSVRGLITVVRSLKTDGGDGNLQIGMVSGASTALGSDRPITTAATYWQDVFEVDPATSAAWTPVAVDAVEIQFDRTL